ncbi:MAG: isoprenylcysteine carboxylmethyltransferase family protein [Gammaproteobacteria bacterium]|nr:isoprenylcysteine carboxylmethyltransferase family protein [Gammaproteobacteria bacterium]
MNNSRSTPRVRLMALAVVACIILVAVTERPTFSGFVSGMAGFLGFVLVAIAALGRLWTSLFIAGRKDTTLVLSGPYAACRHPLYLLSLIGMLGLGLATRSVVLLLALVSIAALLHVGAMRVEDALLERTHGDAARRYRAQVPALVPAWSRYAVPAWMEIQPRVVWKAVLDAGSLLLALALVQAAHVLQHAGAIAPWWRLP